MKIIAHRGASLEYPENTLSAFRRAVEIGVDEIETDLMETRDGVVILHHDAEIHCGTKRSAIQSLTLDEVKQMNPMIPSLDEVLEELGGRVLFCLELKTARLVLKTVSLIQKYGLEAETHFTSFLKEEVCEAKKHCPEASFSWTVLNLPDQIEQDLKRAGLNAISIPCEEVSQEKVQRLTRQGIKTRVFTVNDPVLAERYLAWGVDAIFTDDPKRMLSLRQC